VNFRFFNLDLHLVFHDHAGKSVGDDGIDRLEVFLLLECLCGVAQHEVADRAVVVIGRFARVVDNRFLVKWNCLFGSSALERVTARH